MSPELTSALMATGVATVFFVIFGAVVIRHQTQMQNTWEKDWKNAQNTINEANAQAEKITEDYNRDLSYMVQVSEAMAEIITLQGKLIHPEDLEEEINDVIAEGIAASERLVKVGISTPLAIVEHIPKTDKLINTLSAIYVMENMQKGKLNDD